MTEPTQTDAEWIQTRAEKLKATLFLSWFNNYEQHIAAALTEAMERQREQIAKQLESESKCKRCGFDKCYLICDGMCEIIDAIRKGCGQ